MDDVTSGLVAEVLAEPARVAVVVVDMQRDFCSPTGAFGREGVDIAANARIVPALSEFVGGARSAGAQVVWIKQLWSERHVSPAIRRRLRRAPERTALCLEGSPGAELADGLEVQAADVVVPKYRYSAFLGSSLEQVLRSAGIQTVVVVGTAANGCVDTTVRDAAQREYDVVLAADLVGYSDARLAAAALENLDRHFAYVCTSAEILAALSGPGRETAAGEVMAVSG
jgi:ureidoacrylate peracid hydrolase